MPWPQGKAKCAEEPLGEVCVGPHRAGAPTGWHTVPSWPRHPGTSAQEMPWGGTGQSGCLGSARPHQVSWGCMGPIRAPWGSRASWGQSGQVQSVRASLNQAGYTGSAGAMWGQSGLPWSVRAVWDGPVYLDLTSPGPGAGQRGSCPWCGVNLLGQSWPWQGLWLGALGLRVWLLPVGTLALPFSHPGPAAQGSPCPCQAALGLSSMALGLQLCDVTALTDS